MKAEILKVEGDILTVKLHSPLDVETLSNNKYNDRSFIYLDPWLKGTTTDEQRKHWWALISDISDYTGDPDWKIALRMKYLYMAVHDHTKEPSMARNKMKKDQAAELIQTVIDYCLDNDIPLQKNYLSQMEEKQLFKMTMKRICWVCGTQPADLHHHEGLVGMGRNRKSIDNSQSKYMTLCRTCHTIAHQMGLKKFEELHHLTPITLSKDQLKELNA